MRYMASRLVETPDGFEVQRGVYGENDDGSFTLCPRAYSQLMKVLKAGRSSMAYSPLVEEVRDLDTILLASAILRPAHSTP